MCVHSCVRPRPAFAAITAAIAALVLQSSFAFAQSLAEARIFAAAGAASVDWYGRSVASLDFKADGHPDVVVGAPQNDAGGPDAGRVYLYSGADLAAPPLLFTGVAGEVFGWSIARAGDVNGDGFDDLIVGCPLNSTGTGRALLFFGGLVPNNVADLVIPAQAASEQFGYAVAGAGDVNGDGFDDVIVSGNLNDFNGIDAGRAYVFYGGSVPNAIPDITVTGLAAGDIFGTSVAPAGDYNRDGYDDFLVGAPNNDASAADAGAAYVYYGGPISNNVADVTLLGLATLDHFGFSVANAGDVNGDGNPDALVGAPDNDVAGGGAGAAYLFLGGAQASSTIDLTLLGADAGDAFGRSVAAAGDLNRDGFADLIIGAYLAGTNSQSDGLAYIYLGGTSLNATVDVILSPPPSGESFGIAVAAAGDIDGDGYGDVLVGDYLDTTPPGSSTGRFYVTAIFPYRVLSPNGRETWAVGAPVTARWIGHSVADLEISTDGGLSYVVAYRNLGGMKENEFTFPCPETPTGVARVRIKYTGQTPHRGNSDASDHSFRIVRYQDRAPMAVVLSRTLQQAPGDTVGASLASDDYTGDGNAESLMGAPGNDTGGLNAGAALIVDGLVDPEITPNSPCLLPNPPLWCITAMYGVAPGDGFGSSVASIGDFNGDGYRDWCVGAPRADVGPIVNAGRAYVFFGGPLLDATPDVILSGLAAEDQFGYAVAGAGDFNLDGFADLAVSAPFSDAMGTNAGRVQIFYGGSAPNATADVTLNGQVVGDNFGLALAGGIRLGPSDVHCPPCPLGDPFCLTCPPWMLLVGAPFNDGFAADAGAAYGFVGGQSPDALPDMILYGDQPGSHFGMTVASAGDLNGDRIGDIAIGAPDRDGNGTDAGQVTTVTLREVAQPGIEQPCGVPFPFPDPCCPVCLDPGVFDGEFGGDRFGASLGGLDVNADGLGDLLAGAPGSDAGGVDAGRIYAYPGSVSWGAVGVIDPEYLINGSMAGKMLGAVMGVVPDPDWLPRPEPGFRAQRNDADVPSGPSAAAIETRAEVQPHPDPPRPVDWRRSILTVQRDTAAVVQYTVKRFHLLDNMAGVKWQVGSLQKVSWFGNAGAQVDLSIDGGQTWGTLATVPGSKGREGSGPTGLKHTLAIKVPHSPTKFARLRIWPWPFPPCPPCPTCLTCPPLLGLDVTDTLFTIESSVALLSFTAELGEEGVAIAWSTNQVVAPEGIAGYRLYRVPAGGAGEGMRIGPDLITVTRYTDRDGLAGNRYRLTAVNGAMEELEVGSVTLEPAIHGLQAWPSPVTARGTMNIAFAAPMAAPAVPATDLDIGVFDVSGRRVVSLAQGYVKPVAGVVRLDWNLVNSGGRVGPGVYFIRALSPSARLRLERKVVVMP